MITITIPSNEYYDETNNCFVYIKEQKINLEHSLRSVSKWESKWHKPFLSKTEEKTEAEMLDYIRCMSLTPNVDPVVFNFIPEYEIARIGSYIEDPMTATTIRDDNSPKDRSIITSEILYYDMTALNIPFECDKWHLNRLIMLIRVCNEKNKPKKKIPYSELASRNRALNAARKKKFKTHG